MGQSVSIIKRRCSCLVCWLFAAWSLSTLVWRPNPIPNLSVKRCQFVMALNALGWEGNAKQMDLFAADPYGAMELRTNTTAKTITAHVGEDNVEAMEKPVAKVLLAFTYLEFDTINNNRGQSDIGRLYPEAAVVI